MQMICVAVVCVSLVSAASAEVLIDRVSPAGPTSFDVFGSGFTGTYGVMFLTDGSAGDRDASFTVNSDSHLVVVSGITPQTAAVFTDTGVGVGFRDGDFVDMAISYQNIRHGGGAYLVREGVTMSNPGFGSHIVFLEQNAEYSGGGGSRIMFAKSGAAVYQFGGGPLGLHGKRCNCVFLTSRNPQRDRSTSTDCLRVCPRAGHAVAAGPRRPGDASQTQGLMNESARLPPHS